MVRFAPLETLTLSVRPVQIQHTSAAASDLHNVNTASLTAARRKRCYDEFYCARLVGFGTQFE